MRFFDAIVALCSGFTPGRAGPAARRFQIIPVELCKCAPSAKTGTKQKAHALSRFADLVYIVEFFPACQVRVVRFYVSCPPSSPSSSPLLLRVVLLFLPSFSPSSSPAVCCKVQIAVGSARPQQGARDCSGQRRTSTGSSRLQRGAPERSGQRWASSGEIRSGVGSAGLCPGSSRVEWAAPDLSCEKDTSEEMPIEMPENKSEQNIRKNEKICQRICQKKCQ